MERARSERGAQGRPWWLDLVIEWVPLAVIIYLQFPDEINALAAQLVARLRPTSGDPNLAKLEWHRARAQAGGYADDGGPARDGSLSRPE